MIQIEDDSNTNLIINDIKSDTISTDTTLNNNTESKDENKKE